MLTLLISWKTLLRWRTKRFCRQENKWPLDGFQCIHRKPVLDSGATKCYTIFISELLLSFTVTVRNWGNFNLLHLSHGNWSNLALRDRQPHKYLKKGQRKYIFCFRQWMYRIFFNSRIFLKKYVKRSTD